MWVTDPGNILIAHIHMNVEIGTEAAQCPEKEYRNWFFVAVCGKYPLPPSPIPSLFLLILCLSLSPPLSLPPPLSMKCFLMVDFTRGRKSFKYSGETLQAGNCLKSSQRTYTREQSRKICTKKSPP
jgi:hypothetical protein